MNADLGLLLNGEVATVHFEVFGKVVVAVKSGDFVGEGG